MDSKDILTNDFIKEAISKIRKPEFNTYDLVDIIERDFVFQFNELKKISVNRYASMVGRALIRYSISTHNIRRISPTSSSPSIWRIDH